MKATKDRAPRAHSHQRTNNYRHSVDAFFGVTASSPGAKSSVVALKIGKTFKSSRRSSFLETSLLLRFIGAYGVTLKKTTE